MDNQSYDYSNSLNLEELESKIIEKMPDFSKSLGILVTGDVSAGKTSLICALLGLSKKEAINLAESIKKKKNEEETIENKIQEPLKVSARAGVTPRITYIPLDENLTLVDSPGLDDPKDEYPEITKNYFNNGTYDLALFVLKGEATAAQKSTFNLLKSRGKKIFVILNRIDMWGWPIEPEQIDEIVNQWKDELEIDYIYRTRTYGYDPKQTRDLALEGVEKLRLDIFDFLRIEGKDILLARHMSDKRPYAIGIISSAAITSALSALAPGTIFGVLASQGFGVASLYYLYTGEKLPFKIGLGIIAQTFGIAKVAGIGLFIESIVVTPNPGTPIAAAAGFGITFSLLASVNHILARGLSLEQEELLKSTFEFFQGETGELVRDIGLAIAEKKLSTSKVKEATDEFLRNTKPNNI